MVRCGLNPRQPRQDLVSALQVLILVQRQKMGLYSSVLDRGRVPRGVFEVAGDRNPDVVSYPSVDRRWQVHLGK